MICHNQGIEGFGDTSHGVMIIGIAPGSEEIKSGVPFVGPSGKLLDACLKAASFKREWCYATNLLCWFNNEPTTEQIDQCFPRLSNEILEARPKVIVLLGEIVREYLLGKTVGRGDMVIRNSIYYIPTHHPAAILRGNNSLVIDIVRDLEKINLVLGNSPNPAVQSRVVNDAVEAQSILDNLDLDIAIALDIETGEGDETDPFLHKLLCISISDGTSTYVFTDVACIGLKWPKAHWVLHNGMFDSVGMKKYLGIDLTIVDDTLLMSYALDERGGGHGLKKLSREYLAAEHYEKSMKDDLHTYNATDAAYTARLYHIMKNKLAFEGVEPVYKDLLIPAANAFSEIKYRGVNIDLLTIEALASVWIPESDSRRINLIKMANDLGFIGEINPNSPKQLSKLLFQIVGLDGGPSTRKEVLDEINHPFVDELQNYRQFEHMINTYLLGILDDIKEDGRLHMDILLHGTVTGRRSYHNPALQTIPKYPSRPEVINTSLIRHIFSATNEDYCIVEADYSQAELWCMYMYCKDENLYNDLVSKEGIHRRVAAYLFDKQLHEVTESDRRNSKYVTFGILYGRGAESLAKKELNCSVFKAQRYINAFMGRYPKYKEWLIETKRRIIDDCELTSMTGRKRRFMLILPGGSDRVIRQAINFPIQSLASDLTLSALIDLHSTLKEYDSYVLFDVHDSIMFEVNKKHLAEVTCIIKNTMERPRFAGTSRVPVEIKVGSSWGDVK